MGSWLPERQRPEALLSPEISQANRLPARTAYPQGLIDSGAQADYVPGLERLQSGQIDIQLPQFRIESDWKGVQGDMGLARRLRAGASLPCR